MALRNIFKLASQLKNLTVTDRSGDIEKIFREEKDFHILQKKLEEQILKYNESQLYFMNNVQLQQIISSLKMHFCTANFLIDKQKNHTFVKIFQLIFNHFKVSYFDEKTKKEEFCDLWTILFPSNSKTTMGISTETDDYDFKIHDGFMCAIADRLFFNENAPLSDKELEEISNDLVTFKKLIIHYFNLHPSCKQDLKEYYLSFYYAAKALQEILQNKVSLEEINPYLIKSEYSFQRTLSHNDSYMTSSRDVNRDYHTKYLLMVYQRLILKLLESGDSVNALKYMARKKDCIEETICHYKKRKGKSESKEFDSKIAYCDMQIKNYEKELAIITQEIKSHENKVNEKQSSKIEIMDVAEAESQISTMTANFAKVKLQAPNLAMEKPQAKKTEKLVQFKSGIPFQSNATSREGAFYKLWSKTGAHQYVKIGKKVYEHISQVEDSDLIKKNLESMCETGKVLLSSKGNKGFICISDDKIKLKDCSKDYRFFGNVIERFKDDKGKEHTLYELDEYRPRHKDKAN